MIKYSLVNLEKLLFQSNTRYLEFISSIEDYHSGTKSLIKVSDPVIVEGRKYSGFNFFKDDDLKLFEIIESGEFNISGFQNKHVRMKLNKTSAQISRLLKRLRTHGLVKKVGKSYKYYLTKLGRRVIATANTNNKSGGI